MIFIKLKCQTCGIEKQVVGKLVGDSIEPDSQSIEEEFECSHPYTGDDSHEILEWEYGD